MPVIAPLVFLAWWVIGRLARRPMSRLRLVVLGAFVACALMSLASFSAFQFLDVFIQHLWSFGVVNRLSSTGGLVAGLATLATAVVLIWTLAEWAIDRF